MASAAGVSLVERGKPLDGIDLWRPLAQDRIQPREPLFTATETRQALFLSVLHEGWKLIRIERDQTRALLFRVDVDPNETTDVAAEHPHRVEQLAAVMERWQRRLDASGGREHALIAPARA